MPDPGFWPNLLLLLSILHNLFHLNSLFCCYMYQEVSQTMTIPPAWPLSEQHVAGTEPAGTFLQHQSCSITF